MFRQLIERMISAGNTTPVSVAAVLQADPNDILLAVDQAWEAANVLGVQPPPALAVLPTSPTQPAVPARGLRHAEGYFAQWPPLAAPGLPMGRAWDHLIYAYMIENTRALQIFGRLVREFRTGEALGSASPLTQRWLDITEALLFGAEAPFPSFRATSQLRPEAEAVRRNSYARLFKLELAFGTEVNGPAEYPKALAANSSFVSLLEELLYESWRAVTNIRNQVGMNETDDDRIYRIAEELAFMLDERTQNGNLAREELAAVSAASWIELVLSSNNDVIRDLRAEAVSADGRLKLIGEKLRMAPHSRSDALFGLAVPLSDVLRTVQRRILRDGRDAWLLYATNVPNGVTQPTNAPAPLGPQVQRIITEWSAATGRDLKARKAPVAITGPKQVAVRPG
ncbi:hypothetical protein ABIB37_002614 [Agrococcus sp. UYP10]|uniref:hypothetical protein n=1 Tax=Agrococcus sp. UYP10 TaxID=1756355 RepID=UPI0033915EE2